MKNNKITKTGIKIICHRFFNLNETVNNLMLQMNLSLKEVIVIINKNRNYIMKTNIINKSKEKLFKPKQCSHSKIILNNYFYCPICKKYI